MDRLMVGSNWDSATQMCGSKTNDGHDHDGDDHTTPSPHDGHDHDDDDHDGHDHDGDDHDTADDTSNTASKSQRVGILLPYSVIALAVAIVA